MKSKYEQNLDDIIHIITVSKNTTELIKNCSNLLEEPVTYEALSRAWRRLKKIHHLPKISDLLGSEISTEIFNNDNDLDPNLLIKRPKVKKGPDYLPNIIELNFLPKKVLFVPDIHFPIQDRYAIAALIARARDFCPNWIQLIGDVLDCSCLSWHNSSHKAIKMMDIKYLLRKEIDEAKPFINELLSISDNNVGWLEGNHELRRQKILDQNPGLVGMESLKPKNFFDIPEEVLWVNNDERILIGDVFAEHGNKILNSRGSINIAHSMSQRRPWVNTVVGHWHCCDEKNRVAFHGDGTPETFFTASIGHLSQVHEHHQYARLPNWTLAFAEAHFWIDNGKIRHNFEIVKMNNYQFVRDGKRYDGRKLM